MSRSGSNADGTNNTGHTSLFPMSRLDEFETFTWRIIMKPTLVEPEMEDVE